MSPEKRLFIIDQETTLLAALQEFLQQLGLGVFTYDRIPDLAAEMAEKKPHAVLLGLPIREKSGIDTLKAVKKIDQRIPVLTMTGYGNESERLAFLANGAYAVLAKPFTNFEELFHIVNNSADHYREILRADELKAEVEERHRREKLNTLELEFLKNLQRMVGEAGDPVLVLRNANTLLRGFLSFEYFGSMLMDDQNTDIYIMPEGKHDLEFHRAMVLALTGGEPEKKAASGPSLEYAVSEFKAGNRLFGYGALSREKPFESEEISIFSRFCSHIAVALEKISLFEEIRNLSRRDGLTGVFNHACIVGELVAEIQRSLRYGGPLCVLLVDIDDFKMVNDRFGHLAGDHILKEMARIAKDSVRAIDKVGRYGGDEFLIILPETDLHKALLVAERLRAAVDNAAFDAEGSRIYATVSCGIASYGKGKEEKDLIKEADDNLYRAKKEGKNRIYHDGSR